MKKPARTKFKIVKHTVAGEFFLSVKTDPKKLPDVFWVTAKELGQLKKILP